MKQWIRLPALLLLAVFGLSPVLADDKPLRVGFAQDTLGNDWRLAQVRELEHEFAKYPQVEFIVTDGKGRTAKQISDIENLVHRGIDILITSPRDALAMAPVISHVYATGIPVVLVTRGIPGDSYTTLVGPDDRLIARDAARFLVERLGGHGRVLMLEGVPTATTAIARKEAFIAELGLHPGMQLVASRVGNYLRADALRAVEAVLAEGTRFDAIYAHSDSMAAGARLALAKAGLDPSTIPIVGIDYIDEARAAIRNGRQAASFTYPTSGEATVKTVMAIAAGREVARRIIVDSTRITIDNVEEIEPIF